MVMALIDSICNHIMITVYFLDRVRVAYTPTPCHTYGVSDTAAPCRGQVAVNTLVGRHVLHVKYTFVDTLPTATACAHRPNEALIALDVISAVNMRLDLVHPRIVLTVPAPPMHVVRSKNHGIHHPHTVRRDAHECD